MIKADTLEPTSPNLFTIGHLTCDISEGVIEVDDKLIELEPRLCGVLALLVQRGQNIVTRDEFLDTVWDNNGSDEALTQAISRLRKILGDSSLIETVPRIGYRLAVCPEAAAANPPFRPQSSKISRFNRKYIRAIFVSIILIAVGGTAFWLGTQSSVIDEQQMELEIQEGSDFEFHTIPDSPS